MGYISLPNGGLGPNAQSVTSIWTPNAASSGIPGTDPSNAPFNARQYNWVPLQTTIKSWLLRTTVAPGAAKTANYRFHYGADQILSAIQQIVGAGSTEVSNVIEADVPALDPTSDSTILDTIHYLTGWPSTAGNALGSGYPAIEYAIASNPELAWYICNFGSTGASADFGASNQYSGIVDQAIQAAQNTQAPWQIRMPIKGKLKYAFAVWRGFTSTTTVQAAIQKGARGAGVDTALIFNMIGATTTTPYQADIDEMTVVSVNAGDYLNWRLQRTAGAATTGSILLGVGFAAGV